MARAAQLPRPLLLRCYGREPCILVYGELVLWSHACRWHWLDAPDILSQARGYARSDTLKRRESNSRVRGIVGPSYEVTLSQNYAWALIKNSRRRLMTVLILTGIGAVQGIGHSAFYAILLLVRSDAAEFTRLSAARGFGEIPWIPCRSSWWGMPR